MGKDTLDDFSLSFNQRRRRYILRLTEGYLQ